MIFASILFDVKLRLYFGERRGMHSGELLRILYLAKEDAPFHSIASVKMSL